MGLGSAIGPLSQGEVEAIVGMARTLVLGMLELHATVAGVKQDLRAEDRTMMAAEDSNPLTADWPVETRDRFAKALVDGLAG
jgi:hypothetical protein